MFKSKKEAGVAQLAEQLICNQQVAGSSPITSSIYLGEFPSGQRGQTVNLLATPSVVRIHLPPPNRRCFCNGDLFFIWWVRTTGAMRVKFVRYEPAGEYSGRNRAMRGSWRPVSTPPTKIPNAKAFGILLFTSYYSLLP